MGTNSARRGNVQPMAAREAQEEDMDMDITRASHNSARSQVARRSLLPNTCRHNSNKPVGPTQAPRQCLLQAHRGRALSKPALRRLRATTAISRQVARLLSVSTKAADPLRL